MSKKTCGDSPDQRCPTNVVRIIVGVYLGLMLGELGWVLTHLHS